MTIVRPTTQQQLKEFWAEILFSRTDKVTKSTDGSVINGVGFANAKLGQKALKDIALIQSVFFPDAGSGSILDESAKLFGVSPRLGALGASTYVRLRATPGTFYAAGAHVFETVSGITFTLAEDVTIGDAGFNYGLSNADTTGENTNVDPLTVNAITPAPTGHLNAINEFKAIGGRDIEDDDSFRQRIKESLQSLSTGTQGVIEQAMLKVNPNVLRMFNYGSNGNGKLKLAVAPQNGGNFTANELITLAGAVDKTVSLRDAAPDGLTNTGYLVENIVYEDIDISFRVQLEAGFDVDSVRTNSQIRVNKDLDYRFWVPGSRVEADDLLEIVKRTEGVRYVPDEFFFVNGAGDFFTDYAKLPRIRGFLMLDLDGNIISDGGNLLNPVFYPSSPDFNFQASVLASL